MHRTSTGSEETLLHLVERLTLPTLAEMIQDQIRPTERSEEEHRRIIAEALATQHRAYSCLY